APPRQAIQSCRAGRTAERVRVCRFRAGNLVALAGRRDFKLMSRIFRRYLRCICTGTSPIFAKTGSGDVKKLEEHRDRWRLRSGDFRALFVVQPDGSLLFTSAENRKDAY